MHCYRGSDVQAGYILQRQKETNHIARIKVYWSKMFKDAESNRQVLPISKHFAVTRIVKDFGYRGRGITGSI